MTARDDRSASMSTVAGQPDWSALARPIQSWFTDAKLGIFIHWGPYSVPAWAEPRGELGTIPDREWFARNSYAEWYWNSLKIPDSPTAAHHRRFYGDAPYDSFLDAWAAERFDADELIALVSRAGARYVVPTTKHHDGVTLWPAPGSGSRNSVMRGPKRDLIAEIATAARRQGLRVGAYYSGGLDWGFAPGPPIESRHDLHRPVDKGYADYAYRHVVDLIDRFMPDILWNDIDWPDAGKSDSASGLFNLLGHYRTAIPDGVINDRWGIPLSDFRTSEYQAHVDSESAAAWEHCRGIGLSFGYNQLEGKNESITARDAVRLLVDIVSRGGNLLLNIGPRADGTLPELQRDVLEGLAVWIRDGAKAIYGATPVRDGARFRSDDPWIRWTATADAVFAIVDPEGEDWLEIASIPEEADRATLTGPETLRPHVTAQGVAIKPPLRSRDAMPLVLQFARIDRSSRLDGGPGAR
jgi:alpha-L-fucosidase